MCRGTPRSTCFVGSGRDILKINSMEETGNSVLLGIKEAFEAMRIDDSKKEMATHSSVLVWRILGVSEPGGLPSMGLHRVGHD